MGVNVSDSSESSQFSTQKLKYDAVVLAVGHSARDTYQMLLTHNVNIVPKDFSVSYCSYDLAKTDCSFFNSFLHPSFILYLL